MNLLDITLTFAAALAGGMVNSVAGGGTFLTFPMLIMGGLSPLQANVMSTIALWPGSVASAWTYRARLPEDKKWLIEFAAISAAGGAIGTVILLTSPEVVFERLVPWLLLFATLVFTFGRRLTGLVTKGGKGAAIALQFLIALYGGYFGAGIGILMLAMLHLLGLTHIHQMNAVKTLLGSLINAMAVIIFIAIGEVVWAVAPVMILGGILGGTLGAKLAMNVDPEKVRLLVIAIGVAMTAYFFMRGT